MITSLINLLFPEKKPAITTADLQLCIAASTVQPVITNKAALQARGIMQLDSVHAAAQYHDHIFLEQAICQGKFNNQPALFTALATLLRTVTIPKNAIIVPVPLHWTRQMSRGFNQSDIIAKAIAQLCGNSYQPILRRIRPTGHQAHRDRKERLHAVKNAFSCKPVHAHTAYIIDDICTTGATLDACANALKKAGVQQVHAITLAQS